MAQNYGDSNIRDVLPFVTRVGIYLISAYSAWLRSSNVGIPRIIPSMTWD